MRRSDRSLSPSSSRARPRSRGAAAPRRRRRRPAKKAPRRRRSRPAADGLGRAQEGARREVRRLQVRHVARTRSSPCCRSRSTSGTRTRSRRRPTSRSRIASARTRRPSFARVAARTSRSTRKTTPLGRLDHRGRVRPQHGRVDDGALGERGRQEPAPVLLLLRRQALEDVHLARRLDDPRGQAQLRHVQGRDGRPVRRRRSVDGRHDHVARGRVRRRARSIASRTTTRSASSIEDPQRHAATSLAQREQHKAPPSRRHSSVIKAVIDTDNKDHPDMKSNGGAVDAVIQSNGGGAKK